VIKTTLSKSLGPLLPIMDIYIGHSLNTRAPVPKSTHAMNPVRENILKGPRDIHGRLLTFFIRLGVIASWNYREVLSLRRHGTSGNLTEK
jgi:hypothetical protein